MIKGLIKREEKWILQGNMEIQEEITMKLVHRDKSKYVNSKKVSQYIKYV